MSDRPDITELMRACRAGDYAAALARITAGDDVNARNRNGTTPLMYAKTAAFGSGDLRILTLLLDAGADINARDNSGKTVLAYAGERASNLINFLAERGGTP